MHRFRIPILVFLASLATCAVARAESLFDLARKPKQTTLLTTSEVPPTPEQRTQPPRPPRPAMLRRIDGILAELTQAQVVELIACVDAHPAPPDDAAAGSRRLCFVLIAGPAGDRTIAVDQQPDGTYIAEVISPGPVKSALPTAPRRVLLKPPLFDHFFGAAVGYAGTFDAHALEEANHQPLAEVFALSPPYQNGAFTLDPKTLRERIGTSGTFKIDPVKRTLQSEKFFARLPRGYDPKHPAALLVWVDASPGGQPPPPFFSALDDSTTICIGAANSGNDRPVTDRLQLALDAVATARRNWNIDPDRVYVTGISGGGKMASILVQCFPDVFAGSAPIVGLAVYANVPSGEGRKYWPASFGKPIGKRWEQLRQRRIAAVTGSEDFNHDSILKMFALLERDGLDVKLFDTPGMGHAFPASDAFAAQLAWLDEKPRAAAAQAEADASAALAKALASGDATALIEITRRYPWTAAAWEAVKKQHP